MAPLFSTAHKKTGNNRFEEMAMQDLAAYASDKTALRSLTESNYALPPGVDPFALTQLLINNLASTDSELRDELSYMILANGIIARNLLTNQQTEQILTMMTDEQHLFYRIGEFGTDSVFLRSFSNLVIAAIFYVDAQRVNDPTHKQPILSEESIQHTKAALLRYARAERDWRGYVKDKGWAHALAHLSDALDGCAQNHHMKTEDRKEIMEVVAELAQLAEPFYHEEDVRLASVAYHIILAKQVDNDFIFKWLDRCYVPRDADVISWTRGTNTKNFLRSLYFLLHWAGVFPVLAEKISQVLKKEDEIYLDR